MPSSELSQAQALIPGAYERNTLTHRQMGSQRPRRRVVRQPQHLVMPAGKEEETFPSTGVHSWFPLW